MRKYAWLKNINHMSVRDRRNLISILLIYSVISIYYAILGTQEEKLEANQFVSRHCAIVSKDVNLCEMIDHPLKYNYIRDGSVKQK